MTVHQLRIFSATAKFLNVTKASAELHISQPSVSKQIKMLEAEYGAKFYKKSGRGIRLTDDGRLFLAEIESILVRFDRLQKKSAARLQTQTLAIGGSRSPSASFLPRIASLFKKTHPDATLVLRTDNSDVLERMVIESEIAMAVITNPSHLPQLMYERCREEELVFFAAVEQRLAKQKRATCEDLASAPLVLFKKAKLPAFNKIVEQMAAKSLGLNVAMYCESLDALKSAVMAGIGVGLTYRNLVRPELTRKEFKVIQVAGLVMRPVSYIVYSKQKPLSQNAESFLSLLRKQKG